MTNKSVSKLPRQCGVLNISQPYWLHGLFLGEIGDIDLEKKDCAYGIYNSDGTGTIYHTRLDGSLSYKHRNPSGSKKEIYRLLHCSITSVLDKRKLLVIE
jgi:hypothetical protein